MMRIDRLALSIYLVWLCGVAVAVYFYVSTLTGLKDYGGNVTGGDFVNMWTGGKAVLQGKLDRLFDPAIYRDYQTELFGFQFDAHNWSYPPPLLLFVTPLAWLSYPAALIVWTLVGLALYATVCVRKNAGFGEYAALALAPASFINLNSGQNGFFTAALFWIGLRLLDRRPIAAGVAFGLLTLKPQLGILLPVMLLLDRRWTVIVSAIVTTAALCAVTVLAFGPQIFVSYLHETVPYQTLMFTHGEGLFVRMMPTAFMNARLAGAELSIAWLVQAFSAVLGFVLVLWFWWTSRNFDLRAAALITGTFLVSPYLFVYDMPVFGPVVIALWGRAEGTMDRLMLGILWLLPVMCIVLGLLGLPVSAPLLVLFALWLVIRHSRPVSESAGRSGFAMRGETPA